MFYHRFNFTALVLACGTISPPLAARAPEVPPANDRTGVSKAGPPAVSRAAPTEPAASSRPSASSTGAATKPAPAAAAEPVVRAGDTHLSLSNLHVAKIVPNLCGLHYGVSTTSPECQAFVDQGLGYFYSYVWMEAARSFETATRLDPECATAWWCLFRALDHYGKGDHATQALLKADANKAHV